MLNDVFCIPSAYCILEMNFRTFYVVALLLAGVLFMMFIISRSRDRERLQRQELAKLRLAVDSAYEHIVVTATDGTLLYANKAVERITGYSLKEIIGTKAGKKWGGLMPKEFYVQLWKVISIQKKTFSGEIKNRRKNGEEYYAEVNISPVLDDNGNILNYVGVERDITKEKELDQAKSDFISISSHQLRTPLTVIKGYLSMLMEKTFGAMDDKQMEILSKVYESNEREIGMVQDLLNMSRIEAGRMTFDFVPDDMQLLAASVVDELSNAAKEKGLELRFLKPEQPLPLVNMDAPKLRQVMSNLVENSLKYTPRGYTQVALSVQGKKVRFEVQDSGMGIKPEEMPVIFSKYSRGSDTSSKTKTIKGTGLGLYVGKMIIDAHKGRIWAESAGEGQGSRFIFELPVAPKAKR